MANIEWVTTLSIRRWKPKRVHSLLIGDWSGSTNFATLYRMIFDSHTNEADGSYNDYYDPSRRLIHTYYDWHLIPTSRPVIVPPEKHEESFEVPGMDFFIDTSEALTGYPTFSSRSGSIEFIAEEGYERWLQRYSDYLKYAHGKRCKIVLEDDLDYYYEGFLYLNEQQSGANFNTVTFDYVLEPYKTRIMSSCDEAQMTVRGNTGIQPAWLWDPFNFKTGVIYQKLYQERSYDDHGTLVVNKPALYNRKILTNSGDNDWETVFAVPIPTGVTKPFFGKKPVVPYITVTRIPTVDDVVIEDSVFNGVHGIQIQFYNQDINSTAFIIKTEGGEKYYATNIITIPYDVTYHNELIGLIFTDQTPQGKKILKARGHGIISIDFRGGEL